MQVLEHRAAMAMLRVHYSLFIILFIIHVIITLFFYCTQPQLYLSHMPAQLFVVNGHYAMKGQ